MTFRRILTLALTGLALLALLASPALAGKLAGEIKLGGIVKDEEAGSDLTAIHETFNIYDGFSLTRVNLHGVLGQKNYFALDLREANLDSRRGNFTFRVPDLAKMNFRYRSHRQLLDAAGGLSSEREIWNGSLVVTPTSALRLKANYGLQNRDGDRVIYQANGPGISGGDYEYKLQTGGVGAEYSTGRRNFGLEYSFSDFQDETMARADRRGGLFAVHFRGPCMLAPEYYTHFVRASYGRQELDNLGTESTLSTFQYLGVVKPADPLQLKYRFYADRVDNEVTGYITDYLRNDVDVTYRTHVGSVFGGYGFVTHDDDVTLTKSNVWRAGATARISPRVKAKFSYAGSEKTDEEQLTLLKDVESSRLRASLQIQPTDEMTWGVSYQDRQREFPLLDVSAKGERWSAYGRLVRPGIGALNLDFCYSDDEYDDLYGGYRADNRTVTGRVDLEFIKDLRLSTGLTYLNIGRDLDIEKSILSFEGHYDLLDDYFVEVKYNVYNYDDYVLLDRYYTANVVWMNVGYRLSID